MLKQIGKKRGIISFLLEGFDEFEQNPVKPSKLL